ncbi:Alpha/Beta hydrolase protein [Chaetomium sp. MPI-SDFR-AT-0129]|nr:Alpha/Beta hydrolase protein [Chaetomium sp. MPI-SDFR-AT-0129]
MSELQKKWAKAKFSTAVQHAMAPPPPPLSLAGFNELDEEAEDRFGSGLVPNTPQDDDSSSASSMSSTGTIIPSPGRALFARPQGFPGRSLDPIPWTTYFERELFLPAADGSITYHAYLTSPAPGSASVSSSGAKPSGSSNGGPLFVTHHGAGSSGLSFAVLGAEIRKRLPTAGILSLDARGHGLTTTNPSAAAGSGTATSAGNGDDGVNGVESGGNTAEDLSLTTLASDLLAVLTLTQAAMNWTSLPPVILVGHSLGGAVVTEFASVLLPTLKPLKNTDHSVSSSARPPPLPSSSLPPTHPPPENPASANPLNIDLLGYAVLDVVEGSAIDALQSMHAYLATRPAGFASPRDAVDWHVRSRTLRNAVSARASVPALLVRQRGRGQGKDEDRLGVGVEGNGTIREERDDEAKSGVEEEKDQNATRAWSRTGQGKPDKPWRWRTDLAATQPFWEGWFTGLSKKFLSGRGGKMLLLAGTDRLDTELTIGQMQGKYALQVFPEAGHFIHEDLPEKTAMTLVDFHRRNDRGALVLPPKVSELLAQGKRV